MEGKYLNEYRKQYRDLKLDQGDKERALEIASQEPYSPILKVREAHPEEEPDRKALNEMITEIFTDLQIIDNELAQTAENLLEFMSSTATRLDSVEEILRKEKERQQDINMLCNMYTDFEKIMDLDDSFFQGDFSYKDGVFFAKAENSETVPYKIVSIAGNGYEGNAYVYSGGKFVQEVLDTGNRAFISDESILTAYEYSRITAANSEKHIFPLVNTDSIPAKCAITLHANTAFGKLALRSDADKLLLTGVYTSTDGASFTKRSAREISLTDREGKYTADNHIPGVGIISFPQSNYVRLALQSVGHTDDQIAFYRVDTITV